MSNKIYKEFDKVYLQIEEFLKNYNKSTILQNYFASEFKSFFYATLIDDFFINLNRKNIKEYNLPRGKIGVIKRKYKQLQKSIRLSLLPFSRKKKINSNFYNNFKLEIKKDFPEFQKIISGIEKEIDIKKAKDYLKKKEKEIKKLGKPDKDFSSLLITKILEGYVQKKKYFSNSRETDRLMKVITKKWLLKFSQEVMKTLKRNSKEMIDYQKKYQYGFENRLYKRWKEPLDLLECLIKISLESGEEHKNKLIGTRDNTNNFKREALIKLHARALHISNEILVLLKSGYADGANARWRSLYALAVISFFLLENNNNVSKRYLEHEIVRKFKEVKDYRAYYKKLGYPPIERKEFNKIKREKEKLCQKYNDSFQKDYGWIPSSILSKRDFRALEKHVKLDKLRPFYNLACDSVHGDAKGFYRLGLIDDYQDKILLVGASDYGLADPMQNTAISLLHITICLLSLNADFKSIIQMQVMNNYVNEIGIKAASAQKQIEKEKSSKVN